MPDRKSLQTTLDGIFVPQMPPVRTSDAHIVDWDRQRIVRQIMEETKLVETFYGYESANQETAHEIARLVEERICSLRLKSLSGPLIREIVNITLLERRVRYHDHIARIEVPLNDIPVILTQAKKIIKQLKTLGFHLHYPGPGRIPIRESQRGT